MTLLSVLTQRLGRSFFCPPMGEAAPYRLTSGAC